MGYTKAQREAKLQNEKSEVQNKEIVTEKNEEIIQEPVIEKEKLPINNLPLLTNVWVRSNCYGELIYISKKTGFRTSWDNFRSRQPMTLEELMTMRNTYIKFFTKNLIIIEGFQDPEYAETYSVEEILAYLQVSQYYKSSLCPDNLEEVFRMTPAKIEECVPNMSSGVKSAITIRANELITSGQLDSMKLVASLEKALGCELCRP